MKTLANAFAIVALLTVSLQIFNRVNIYMDNWDENSNYNRGITNVRRVNHY